MGASSTHTEDTALQTPVRFRSGQIVCYQSFARAQGGTREFASRVLPQRFQLTLQATGAVAESGAAAVWVHVSPRMALRSGWAWVWL